MNKTINKYLMTLSLVLVMVTGLFGVNTKVYAASGDTTVYITKSGKCYHSDGCSSLSKSKIETTLQSAVDKGYKACSKCNPVTLDSSSSKATDSTTAEKKSASSKKETATTSKASVSTSVGKATGKSSTGTTSNSSKSAQKTDKKASTDDKSTSVEKTEKTETTYVLNTSTKKFHYSSCKDVKKIKAENYATSTSSRDDIVGQGYSPCGHCNP
ncbi:hypothetical protein [Butyrivibrio sp. VCB2006]|uniref:hypothetical protein n=1 Tax=Butyrivibrio sp. VCB2006 TaxID=1280679 RepID=UPI0003F9BF80|nr:hypothetical protein [Butyrivibrio sp. VCB2006]